MSLLFPSSLSHPNPIPLCFHTAFLQLMPYISISVFFHISLSPSSVTLPICHSTSPSIPQPFSHLSVVSIYLISSPTLISQSIFAIFSHILSIHSLMQGKGISKSASMNCGPCPGMPQGLTHSDSYTWAVENRRPSTSRSIHRESSFSSLSSQDLSMPDLYSDNCVRTESQVK